MQVVPFREYVEVRQSGSSRIRHSEVPHVDLSSDMPLSDPNVAHLEVTKQVRAGIGVGSSFHVLFQ